MDSHILIVGALILTGVALMIDYAYHWVFLKGLLPSDLKKFFLNVGYGFFPAGLIVLGSTTSAAPYEGYVMLFLGYVLVKISDILK